MLEKIGENDVIVRNYTENMSIKEYLEDVLIDKAFPNIALSKSNLSLNGIHAEYVAQGIEDSVATASLMINEAFITKAQLPSSIYSHAALFELGYSFAVPSSATFALQLSMDDIIQYSQPVVNTSIYRYILDRDTGIVINNSTYKLDYDIYIDHRFIDGKRVFSIYYNMDTPCYISKIKSKFIKYVSTSINWLVLILNLNEFDRVVDDEAITDNTVTTNSDITIKWSRQLAGLDLAYISPSGQRLQMKMKPIYTKPETEPFVWYHYIDDYTIALSFSSNNGYWKPEFNSKIEYTIYTCNGSKSNFTAFNSKTGLDVIKGDRYAYNADTMMVAMCYSAATGGMDKGDIELLRNDIELAYNTANVLTTDADFQSWFENYAKRNGTKATFFKRRDDISGRLFSQFIAIKDGSYMYPTNTLNIIVNSSECDSVTDNNEFVIKAGHLWEYDDTDPEHLSRNTVRMIEGGKMISDKDIPIVSDGHYMFTNPFTIRIYKSPTISMNYNYLINHVSMPEDELSNNESFYQFQLAQFSIQRTLSSKHNNMYHIEVICVPVVSDTDMVYVQSLEDYTSDTTDIEIATYADLPKKYSQWNSSWGTYVVGTVFTVISDENHSNQKWKYKVTAVINPTTDPEYDKDIIYEDAGSAEPSITDNNLRMVMVCKDHIHGETGYIEMIPTIKRDTGSYIFETDIAVTDTLTADMLMEVDLTKTPDMKSLIPEQQPDSGKVFVDTAEGDFSFICIINDPEHPSTTTLYNDPSFNGYMIADRFMNDRRSLVLYEPLSMMRSTITFDGVPDDYDITASMIPMLRWDIPLDDEKMEYFTKAFDTQYAAMKPALDKLNGNDYIDMKLYNTYGRSNNYYVGPMNKDEPDLHKSAELLDNVYVKVRLRIAVYDRSIYAQTVTDVISEIIKTFESLTSDKTDIHASEIIQNIANNHPNVKYIRFLGFNDYDAITQSIFVKYAINDMNEYQLKEAVPEIMRVDADSIEITEEV